MAASTGVNAVCVVGMPDACREITRRCAAHHHIQRGLGAQDGAADGLGDLRQNRVAEGLDDQACRRCPFARAERNARASQPGGKPIIQP